jgi:hypothetical protein
VVACALFKVVEITGAGERSGSEEESNASTTPLPIHREQETDYNNQRGELKKGAKKVVRKDAGR